MENRDIRTNQSSVSKIFLRFWEHPWSAVLVFSVGAVLRLLQLTTNGLWLDEIWSMQTSASTNSIAQIIEICKNDTHPPLFDIILHGWLIVFGDTDLSGRMLAFSIGILGMAATWYYALRISGKRTSALIALSVVSFSYFHIYYSNEVRFYGFLYLCALISIAHLYLFLKRSNTPDLLIATLSTIVIMYTHYYGLFLLGSFGLIAITLKLFDEIPNRRFLTVITAGLFAALAFLPWVPAISTGGVTNNWIAPPKIYDFVIYLYNYTGKNPVEFLMLVGGLVLAAIQFRKDKTRSILLFGVLLFGFLIPFIVSWVITPVLHDRYTMVYYPALVLLVTLGWSETEKLNWFLRTLIFAAVWLAIAVNFMFIHPYFREETKEPWRTVARDLSLEKKAPVYSEMKFWIDYYLDQKQLPKARSLDHWKAEEAFWYLRTPYDEQSFPALDSSQYQRIRKIEYPKDFSLELYKRSN